MTELRVDNPFELTMAHRPLVAMVERFLGLTRLADCYRQRPLRLDPQEFLQYTLDKLCSQVTIGGKGQHDGIPSSGPLLIFANHPLGGLEGVAIARMLLSVRSDVKVITNQLLCRIPELRDVFIGVDILSEHTERSNVKALLQAGRHLKTGGALLIFPAGVVAAISPTRWCIQEQPWHRLLGRFALKYRANCLPVYVEGRNSKFFYLLGLIHPRLRTLWLARELANKQGKVLRLTVGEIITPDDFMGVGDDESVTSYLRMNTEILAVANEPVTDKQSVPPKMPILPCEEVVAAINNLEDCRLLTKGDFSVFCAPFARMSVLMKYLGAVRELTFRAAGEGTGNDEDIDRFDPHYLHLFIWDQVRHTVVGGYRIGKTDEIVARYGIDGLYSRSLYAFDQKFIQDLGPALEMGRSFIQPDYQRCPEVLDLLWRGIGAYVARDLNYCILFGAVSISRNYSTLARQLISECMLKNFCAEQKHLQKVSPLKPIKTSERIWSAEAWAMLSNIKVLNKLVGRCDPGKTIPILLRHYLSLNGRFVCFSLNTGFHDSLDGLMMVDLRKTPKKYLSRYLGKAAAECFLHKWGC